MVSVKSAVFAVLVAILFWATVVSLGPGAIMIAAAVRVGPMPALSVPVFVLVVLLGVADQAPVSGCYYVHEVRPGFLRRLVDLGFFSGLMQPCTLLFGEIV